MNGRDQPPITQLLLDWRAGNQSAFDQLVPLVYSELRRMASSYMRGERPGHPLQTSALVNEAYLRLVNQPAVQWQDRAHFFAISATVMRNILVDYARRNNRSKRGGGQSAVDLDEHSAATTEPTEDILAVHEALTRLEQFDSRKAKVVEMRFFGGMSVSETAAVLGVSENTIIRDWSLARAWLRSSLSRTRE